MLRVPVRLVGFWDRTRTGLWLLPVLCIAGGVVLVVLMIGLDSFLEGQVKLPAWLTSTADGAQTVLSTIAGGMITVAGVVLSMTMVTLSQTSSQFGSRVLRRRLTDRTTQWTEGAFLGTTIFSLLVLKSVLGTEETQEFVPHLSVLMAILLALVSLVMLLYFVHQVTMTAQASEIVAMLATDLRHSIERIFPEKVGEPSPAEIPREKAVPPEVRQALSKGKQIYSHHEGYIQVVDGDWLLSLAVRDNLVIQLPHRPGDFVARGECIAIVVPNGRFDHDAISRGIHTAFVLGNVRIPRQDVNCAVHELSQMAVRALSPAINDPYTAVNCIDRLSSAMAQLTRRHMPETNRFDHEGNLRLLFDRQTFGGVMLAAFDQIRYEAHRSVAVSERLLEGLERIARCAQTHEHAAAVALQSRLILDRLLEAGHHPSDLQKLQEKNSRIQEQLSPLLNQPHPTTADVTPPEETDPQEGATGEVIG